MARALEAAKRGIGFTAPNPCVGAILVKDGIIIGEGWHKRVVNSHAEAMAIENAKEQQHSIKGSTLYVTLEPCCQYGRTPPCTNTIARHGIKKVVIGSIDTFWRIHKEGIKQLRQLGVEVELMSKRDTLYKSIIALNQPFLKWASVGLPYVVMKHSASFSKNTVIKDDDSIRTVHYKKVQKDEDYELNISDAVLVDWQYVQVRDPVFQPNGYYRYKKVLRVILDPELNCDIDKQVFRDGNVLVVHTTKAPASRVHLYHEAGIPCFAFETSDMQIKKLLQYLGKKKITRLLVEGGNDIYQLFADEALYDPIIIDSVLWYITPVDEDNENPKHIVLPSGGVGRVSMVDEKLDIKSATSQQIGKTLKYIGRVNIY